MYLKENAIAHSLGHAVLVVIYVAVVAWIMQHAQAWFGHGKAVFAPMAFLMLFVLSAAVVGSLVVGRPALMYVDGQKKEALKFFGFTVLWLGVLTIGVFIILAARK